MPFAWIAGRSLEVADVRFSENSFVLLSPSGEPINPTLFTPFDLHPLTKFSPVL
jgi:hypothetical protein